MVISIYLKSWKLLTKQSHTTRVGAEGKRLKIQTNILKICKKLIDALINKQIKKLMPVPSDSTNAPKSQGQLDYSISSLHLEYFEKKFQFSEPLEELSFQNKILLILLHKDIYIKISPSYV